MLSSTCFCFCLPRWLSAYLPPFFPPFLFIVHPSSSTTPPSTMTTTTAPNSVLQSRVLALMLRGWLEKHNRPAVKFAYLLELVRSLRYLVQRSNIMTSADDLTAMVFINAERFIASTNSIDHTLHTILFTRYALFSLPFCVINLF